MEKIENGQPVKSQFVYPLAPDCGLQPITWKQAPKDPHGYYDRMHYARGWNDAVSVAQAKFGEPVREIYVPIIENICAWVACDKEAYDLCVPSKRRIIHIIQE